MVSVMPPFGGHLGTGSTVFGGGPADTRVELTGLNTRYHFAVEANTASSLATSAVAYEGRPGPPSDPDDEGRQQVGMTTRGKYMQNHGGGKNPHNYSHPGKLSASKGKNSRNSYDDDEEEDEDDDDDDDDSDEDDEPPPKVIVTHPNGVQRGRRGPVGKNIYNQRVERDRSCSESDGAYDEPSSPAESTGVTTRGKRGKIVQSNEDQSSTSYSSGGKGGNYANRGKGGKSIGKRVPGKQNPSIGKRGSASTSAGKIAPSIGKRNPSNVGKGKRTPSIGKKIPNASSGKRQPAQGSSSYGKGKRVPSVGKRVPTKGKRASNTAANVDNSNASDTSDKERQPQPRKSRGKNIENLQRHPHNSTSNRAVNEERPTSSNPGTNGYDSNATGAVQLFPPDIYSSDHHHHHYLHHQHLCAPGGPLMMPPPPPPQQTQSNNQRITRGKNILNQQQHSQHNMPENLGNNSVSASSSKSTSSATNMPSASSSLSSSSTCMPFFMQPSTYDMTVINSSNNDCFSSNAWQQNPQGNPYFYPPQIHPQQTEQQQEQQHQQQYYLRRRTSSISNPSPNNDGISSNFDPSKGDGGPPKVRNASQKQQFYNSHPSDVPLFVDCSVEYELPGVPKPETSNDNGSADQNRNDRLLMVPPGWQQKRRITRSTSQQRLLEQQQWFRQHHQMQQEYQLQMQQQQQLNHQRASFSGLPAATTSSSSAATSSITAVSNANSSRQHPYSQPQFGGNGNSNNPNSSNNSVYNNSNNMFSQSGVLHPPQNLRPPFYPPIPPMHYCPQCPPMINAHPPSMIGGGFVHPGVGSSQHLPPPAYPNNNMATSTTSSTKMSSQSAATTSSASNGSSSRKRSYAEATATSSIQQQQIQQRMQFQQLQQQVQAEDHRQQMNMRIGNNIGSRDDRSKTTTTTSSGSSKRSRVSSSATTTSNVNKTGRSNGSNDVRNSTENAQTTKPSLSTAAQSSTIPTVLHEKLPNGVCSCGATGQFVPPSQGGPVNLGPPNQGSVQPPRSMAPPAAHSNQRPQVHPQSQIQQRQQHHMHLQQHHQQQLMQQQWALSAHQRQRWSSSMVCCPPPLPAPPPPISGQPTFPTSHYWNEIVPTTTSASNSSNFQAPRPVRQATSNNKRTLRSQQQNQTDQQQYSQNGNQTATSTDSSVSNGWIIGGPNFYQQQKQQHWLQQRYLQHQQNYHNLHQNHLAQQQLPQQHPPQNIPLVPHLLQHNQSVHPCPPNNNNSLCRGCAEGKCPAALSSSGPSSLVALPLTFQRPSSMIQMQPSSGSSKSSF